MVRQRCLLIIEGEGKIYKLLWQTLTLEGFHLVVVGTKKEALNYLNGQLVDLILLNPDELETSGLDLCLGIRQSSNIPIIILTALKNEDIKLKMLNGGVDDYLISPFTLAEIVARINMVLRRCGEKIETIPTQIFQLGPLEINLHDRVVQRDHKRIKLSHTEWSILELLLLHAGEPVSHRLLLQTIWGPAYTQEVTYLRFYISRLRQKLEENQANPHYILTVPGMGYRILIPETFPSASSTSPEVTEREREETPPITVRSIDPSPEDPHVSVVAPRGPYAVLPYPVSEIIDREEETIILRGLLQNPAVRLLTLTGPGGVGKTSLTLRLMHHLTADFRDGIYFVPLFNVQEAAEVLPLIVQTLGLKNKPASGEVELADYLHDKEMLLILDNFEHLLQAALLISRLLAAAPRLKVMTTSREHLQISGEYEFNLTPLPLPVCEGSDCGEEIAENPAVALFLRRAQAIHYDFSLTAENSPVIAEICRKLEGLPLSLELAALRLRVYNPETLLKKLEDRFTILTGGPRNLPLHQRSLLGSLDWSYALLKPAEKLLFARLGLAKDGDDIARFAAIGADNDYGESTPGELLSALVAKNLLQIEPGPASGGEMKFRLSETLRAYALRKLAENGEAANPTQLRGN